MASSNPTHVSNINDQHAVDATKLVASARNHLVYVESVVNTANVPQDAQEQVASRTLAWATQNQPHAKNNYLKFLGYTAMQGALHLLPGGWITASRVPGFPGSVFSLAD